MGEIISFLKYLFGIGIEEISILQMLSRSVVIYMIGIFLVRIGKKRFVGKMTAFDIIIAIIIGSLLSRAITNKDFFLEILASCFVLILMHRFISYISAIYDWCATLIKGREKLLIVEGEINWKQMKKSHLSEKDLLQSLRLNTNREDISKVKIARLERNGDISFVLNDEDK